MKKTDPNMLLFMSSFFLPEGMLDFFDIVRVDEESRPEEEIHTGGVLHIHLDEQDNRTAEQQTKLPESKWIITEEGKVLKDVGRVNSYIARTRFDVNAQPNYALLDASGNLLVPVRGYDLSIEGFIDFLNSAL